MKGYEHIDGIDNYLSSLDMKKQRGTMSEFDRLIIENLRFVVSVAKNYRGCGVPFDELISEGNMGLVTAALKFDASKGTKFITYAVYWIKSYIVKCIEDNANNNKTIDDIYDTLKRQKDDIDNEETVLNSVSASSAVEDLTSCLKEREMQMISMYFGLNGETESTYKEIGERFGVTSECARQTVNTSISKMKKNAVCNEHFKEYQMLSAG